MLDIIGSVGVICILIAYALLQRGKLKADEPLYPLLNLIGAVLILISFLGAWNLSAFVLEAAWALISIYGLIKALQKKNA